ncbi:GMC family oxidoreductase [Methylosinus sporium]|uniref:GMC family oxidoreductase n=2 Tax=Methylocystaceae TaxID=31993 RepID=A0A549T4H5_METSR|nr:GMC family oxidoreductase [Methylosinus sporium]
MSILDVDATIIGGGLVGTLVAKLLVRRGMRVALIEKGPAALADQLEARPNVRCSARRHDGVYNARNHVLGGNGHYWGGGLVRPRNTTLRAVLGLALSGNSTSEDLAPYFDVVEADVGLEESPRNDRVFVSDGAIKDCWLSETVVLPGRVRNLAASALEFLRGTKSCTIICDSEIMHFDQGGPRRRLGVLSRGKRIDVVCDGLFLCAGTIDTLLLVRRLGSALHSSRMHSIGANVHDHISMPIGEVTIGESRAFQEFLFPTFRGNCIVGKRLELESADDSMRGVLHFQFRFDDSPLYRQIKRILALRQQRAGSIEILWAMTKASPHIFELCRIGYVRFVNSRLHVSRNVPVIVTLDVESTCCGDNKVEFDEFGDVVMSWDVRRDDEVAFERLYERARVILLELAEKYRVQIKPLGDISTFEGRLDHLRREATDAYHLGGGLVLGEVIDDRLRLIGAENVYVISSAVFQRPGLANPTMSLMALAHRCVDDLCFELGRMPKCERRSRADQPRRGIPS